jgi:transposase
MRRGPGPAFAKVMEDQHANTAAEAYFRVAIWIGSLQEEPKPERIMRRFGVHRSTAYRWIAAWKCATGVAA